METSNESAKFVTMEDLERFWEEIKNYKPQPHVCLIHPRGGWCYCGQHFSKTDSGYINDTEEMIKRLLRAKDE